MYYHSLNHRVKLATKSHLHQMVISQDFDGVPYKKYHSKGSSGMGHSRTLICVNASAVPLQSGKLKGGMEKERRKKQTVMFLFMHYSCPRHAIPLYCFLFMVGTLAYGRPEPIPEIPLITSKREKESYLGVTRMNRQIARSLNNWYLIPREFRFDNTHAIQI